MLWMWPRYLPCLTFQVVESLGLSFHNAAGLHKHVDSMPSEAPWSTRDIVFSDQPNNHYTVQYRDVIDGVKALLGDPSLADKLVYRPKRVFTDKSKKSRIYSEMWTGVWWSTVQVSTLFILSSELFIK